MIHKETVDSRKASVDSAKAQLDTALLNLSYCHIVAPVDGIANRRSAEVGARIAQGQQLIVVVQIDGVWENANFKETQLKKMRAGQRVTISVDSLGESFEGRIENMPAATGDRSSLFPPENATGNYVKIVLKFEHSATSKLPRDFRGATITGFRLSWRVGEEIPEGTSEFPGGEAVDFLVVHRRCRPTGDETSSHRSFSRREKRS